MITNIVKLRDVCEFLYGKGLPQRAREKGEFPVYGSGGIVDYHRTYLTEGPGIIVGRKGTIGSVFYEKKNFYPIDTVYYVKTNESICDTKYLYYSLLTIGLSKLNTDAAVPGLNRNVAYEQKLSLPPKGVQRKIASILSAYDDLIENNLKQIKVLEEMAQMIYREWFVNFRFPGHEKVKMVKSELGMIPEGWHIVRLEDVCSRITDGSHSSPKSVESGYPMASVKDMHDYGFNIDSCRNICPEDYNSLVRNDCKPLSNDVLIAKDGSYLKHVFVVEKETDLVILSSIAILRPNEKISSHYLAFYLRDPQVKARLKGYVSGAALPRIILKDFRQFKLLLPNDMLQKKWTEIVAPMITQCWRLIDKSNNLCKTRDLLLPKLISGEIDVEDLDINTVGLEQ